jgi:acetyl-CoA decarbonylase/synthase complex subunit gamma
LIPVDVVSGRYYLLAACALLFVLSGIGHHGYTIQELQTHGLQAIVNILAAYAAGIVFTPLALPYLPVRMFSAKGAMAGLLVTLVLFLAGMTGESPAEWIAWLLMISSIASFIAMNFTGSSTFTSLSGVKKEMRISLPLQITGAALGLALFVVSKII